MLLLPSACFERCVALHEPHEVKTHLSSCFAKLKIKQPKKYLFVCSDQVALLASHREPDILSGQQQPHTKDSHGEGHL